MKPFGSYNNRGLNMLETNSILVLVEVNTAIG